MLSQELILVIVRKKGYKRKGLLTVNFVVYFVAFLSDVDTVAGMTSEM
jgi:hypothetical protein